MKQSNKWAEQCLVENTFGHKDENGNEVINKLNCLQVCLSGKELYKKEFMEGKYKGKNMLAMPYDFIVEAGDMCPKGAFYELEYTIGEYGMVYRALIQAVDPVTDLPLIIGVLKKKNLLPANFKSHRAWLREDIGAVCVGNCSKDEDGEACFYSGHNEAHDGTMDDGTRLSVLDYAVKYGNLGCCIYYYRGDLREVWIPQECDCSKEKVFICGVNGDDPAFAEKKAKDLDEMWDLLSQATEIARDYAIPYFYIWQSEDDRFEVDTEGMTHEMLDKMLDAMKKGSNGNS